jgi:site-specific DNA recombinase
MKSDKKLRYIAYVRKSEERKERQELSHKAQVRKIREHFPDLNIVKWMEPESKSAFKTGRPIYKERGEADGIVAYYPNRLSRNEIDSGRLTYALRDSLKDLKFCTYTFENTPEGVMMLQMIMNQGQYESSKQGRDVKRGMEEKALGGERPGQVPQGYIKVPILDKYGNVMKKKDNKIVTRTTDDPDRWHLIDKMWDMLLYEHYKPEQIWKKADKEWGYRTRKTTFGENSTGDKPMPKSMMYSIFTNRFYAGLIPHNGEWYKGNHHAMITPDEFDYAQKLLGTKGAPRKSVHNFAYGSLLHCGTCNCQIVAKATTKLIKSSNELKTYVHYYCTRKSIVRPCDQRKYKTLEDLESEIDAELAKYTIIPEFRDMALKILRRNHKAEVGDRTHVYESQQKLRKSIQSQLDSLTDKLTRGIVDEDDYVRQKNILKAQLNEIDSGLRGTEKRAEDWLELTERAFDFATYARIQFAETKDPMVKRDILKTLGVNLLLKDNKLSLTPNEWLIPIERDYPALEKAYLKVRTNKKATTKELEAALASIFESWRARRDLNPRHPA